MDALNYDTSLPLCQKKKAVGSTAGFVWLTQFKETQKDLQKKLITENTILDRQKFSENFIRNRFQRKYRTE